jgi:hypothetical protein
MLADATVSVALSFNNGQYSVYGRLISPNPDKPEPMVTAKTKKKQRRWN